MVARNWRARKRPQPKKRPQQGKALGKNRLLL